MSPDVASLNQQFFTTKKILQQIKTLAPLQTGIYRFHLYGQRQMILLINHQWENFSANNFLTQQKQVRNGFVNDTVKNAIIFVWVIPTVIQFSPLKRLL